MLKTRHVIQQDSVLAAGDDRYDLDADAGGPDLSLETGAGPWDALGYEDLGDIARRIYTLCGWTRAQGSQSLAITSAQAGEGKSTIARAVAISAAADLHGSVLLVEADLVHPDLVSDFGLEDGPGLTELLEADGDLVDSLAAGLRPTRFPNLWLLPAGDVAAENPSRLLRSPRMAELLALAEQRFEFVIVDLPAVLRHNDAAVLARLADGVVFIIQSGATRPAEVKQALWLLSGAVVHGVVVNRLRNSVPRLFRPLVDL